MQMKAFASYLTHTLRKWNVPILGIAAALAQLGGVGAGFPRHDCANLRLLGWGIQYSIAG